MKATPWTHHNHHHFHQQDPHTHHRPHTLPHQHHLSMKAHSEEGLGSERFWWVRTAQVVTMHNGRPIIDLLWSYHRAWRWWSWTISQSNNLKKGRLIMMMMMRMKVLAWHGQPISFSKELKSEFQNRRLLMLQLPTFPLFSKCPLLEERTWQILQFLSLTQWYETSFRSGKFFLLCLENYSAPRQPIGQILSKLSYFWMKVITFYFV